MSALSRRLQRHTLTSVREIQQIEQIYKKDFVRF